MTRGLLRGVIGVQRLLVGRVCGLVGRISLSLRLQDSGLRPRIHVLDVARIAGIHIIQFRQPVIDRVGLPFHPLLAGERIDAAPEPFPRLAHGMFERRGGLLRSRGRHALGIRSGWLRLLRPDRNCHSRSQHNNCEVTRGQKSIRSLHFFYPFLNSRRLKATVD